MIFLDYLLLSNLFLFHRLANVDFPVEMASLFTVRANRAGVRKVNASVDCVIGRRLRIPTVITIGIIFQIEKLAVVFEQLQLCFAEDAVTRFDKCSLVAGRADYHSIHSSSFFLASFAAVGVICTSPARLCQTCPFGRTWFLRGFSFGRPA